MLRETSVTVDGGVPFPSGGEYLLWQLCIAPMLRVDASERLDIRWPLSKSVDDIGRAGVEFSLKSSGRRVWTCLSITRCRELQHDASEIRYIEIAAA
jgi:hypothetical protein